jgi:hypothetical protein
MVQVARHLLPHLFNKKIKDTSQYDPKQKSENVQTHFKKQTHFKNVAYGTKIHRQDQDCTRIKFYGSYMLNLSIMGPTGL